MMPGALRWLLIGLAAVAVWWMLRREKRGSVLAFFGLLAVAATYPLVFDPFRMMLTAGGGSDVFLYLWDYWWVGKAVLELHESPLFCPLIYHPFGAGLSLHALSLLQALIFLPVQAALPGLDGLVLAYNLTVVASFWLSGYAVYRLAFHLVPRRSAALFAGIAFALCNYHYANIVRIHALSIEWLPICMWLLVRFEQRHRVRDALWLGLGFAALFWTSLEYAYFFVVFALLWALAQAIVTRRWTLGFRLPDLGRLGLGAATSLALTAPFWLSFAAEPGGAVTADPEHARFFSADLLDLWLPNARHPLWGGAMSRVQAYLHDGDTGFGLGMSLVVWAAAAFGIARAFRNRSNAMLVWFGLLVTFGVLMLGPSLHVAGRDTGIPLLYAGLARVLPLFEQARMPMRFVVPFLAALGVLAAYGLDQALRVSSPRSGRLLWIGAFLFLAVETLSVPLPLERVQVPALLEQLEDQDGDSALLELVPGAEPVPMAENLHQIVHGKRLVQDIPWFLPRVPRRAVAVARSRWFVRLMGDLGDRSGLSCLMPWRIHESRLQMARLGIRHVAVHKRGLSAGDLAGCRLALQCHGAVRLQEDETLILARFPW